MAGIGNDIVDSGVGSIALLYQLFLAHAGQSRLRLRSQDTKELPHLRQLTRPERVECGGGRLWREGTLLGSDSTTAGSFSGGEDKVTLDGRDRALRGTGPR